MLLKLFLLIALLTTGALSVAVVECDLAVVSGDTVITIGMGTAVVSNGGATVNDMATLNTCISTLV